VPLIATMLVSVASRREDSEFTLGGPAPGPTEAFGRRILGFHSPVVRRRAQARRTHPVSHRELPLDDELPTVAAGRR